MKRCSLHAFCVLAVAAIPVLSKAQDSETPAADISEQGEQRSVGLNMRGLLDEGVEIGCLSHAPPASYSQTEDDSAECREFIARLAAETDPSAGTLQANEVADPDNPWRNVPLGELVRAAESDNKQAQLELGIRYEEGVGGVEQDWVRALELYSQAGRPTPARRGYGINREAEAGMGGSVTQRQLSRRIPGLSEARARRDALEARLEEAGRGE